MMRSNRKRRLTLYMVSTFCITWIAWGTLALGAPADGSVFSDPLTTTLYLLGGFGPTIAALITVAMTPGEGSYSEYAVGLFRWRIAPVWYVWVLAIPPMMAFGVEHIAAWCSPKDIRLAALEPLARLPLLFVSMTVGGGLEELGWRGVAQPELQQRLPLLFATLLVGALWALWHLPLFFIHGVPQFGGDFPLFGVGVLANAFLLAWVYFHTRSILMCVLFHAASNTASAMGLDVVGTSMEGRWLAATIKLAVAVLLLALSAKRTTAARLRRFTLS
jgi:uncharacterized protein